MSDILKRPNGKYWTSQDIQELNEAKNHGELAKIAIRVLRRMPQPITQICGPLTTGGLGSIEANAAEFDMAIHHFTAQGESVFDQMPFEEPMQRLKEDMIDGYDERILFEFYQPIFKSGLIKKMRFLPGWKDSIGATWEDNQADTWHIEKIYLPKDWHRGKSDYERRGVSSDKEEVHAAIEKVDKGIFPKAFCKIIPDMFAGDPEFGNIVHADGAGTKTSLAYIYWKETGDMSVWKGVAQDSIVMNLDDLICIGATKVPMLLSATIGRNKHLVPGKVIAAIINGAEEFCAEMRKLGINIYTTGGETADIGDLVRTIAIDNTLTCRIKKSDVINVNIQPSDLIVGLASFGQATYEDEYNGGMGSNGLTSSRHDVFHKGYIEKYPETFDPILLMDCPELVYRGHYRVTDDIPWEYFGNHPYQRPENVGKLVLSPTRTYAPIIKEVIHAIGREHIHGIIHCSGGGQTKVMKFVENIHIIKDSLFPIPPLFELIGKESGTKRQEMYKTFNMGHRMELYVPDLATAKQIQEISESFHVEGKIIGHVERNDKNKLTIKDEHGEYIYEG